MIAREICLRFLGSVAALATTFNLHDANYEEEYADNEHWPCARNPIKTHENK
jgi:hypothetical protein